MQALCRGKMCPLMDWHIYIGVAIGAAITVIVGSFLKWTFSIFDAIIPVSTASEKVRKIVGVKQYRVFFWDALFLSNAVYAFVGFVRDKSPITRWTIVAGTCAVIGLGFWVCVPMYHVIRIITRKQLDKEYAQMRALAGERASSA